MQSLPNLKVFWCSLEEILVSIAIDKSSDTKYFSSQLSALRGAGDSAARGVTQGAGF